MHCYPLRWHPVQGWSFPTGNVTLERDQSVVIFFGERESLFHSSNPLKALCQRFPETLVVGCSTAGEILGTEVSLGGVVALALSFESTRVSLAEVRVKPGESSRSAGESLARAVEKEDLCGVFVLSDGTQVNGTQLMEGLYDVFPAGLPISGGLAGDGDQFRSTSVGVGEDLQAGRVLALGFHGQKLKIRSGSAGGWEPFGPYRRITKSTDNVLHELDGEPALAIYKRYLGPRAAELPSAALLFPLEVYHNEQSQAGVVRTILSIDEKAQTMTFAGDMREGSLARLMHAGPERLVLGAQLAAENADGQSKTDAAILVSCVGRRLVLRQRAEDEVAEVLGVIGSDVPVAGFYSYGELCPARAGGCSELHNQTMTVTLFREET